MGRWGEAVIGCFARAFSLLPTVSEAVRNWRAYERAAGEISLAMRAPWPCDYCGGKHSHREEVCPSIAPVLRDVSAQTIHGWDEVKRAWDALLRAAERLDLPLPSPVSARGLLMSASHAVAEGGGGSLESWIKDLTSVGREFLK